jgi:hypothetical protein
VTCAHVSHKTIASALCMRFDQSVTTGKHAVRTAHCLTCVPSLVALEWTLGDASAAEAVCFNTLGDACDDLLVHLQSTSIQSKH